MKRIILIFYFFFIPFIFASNSESANWKLYAKNAPLEQGVEGDAYYDKDSVYYDDSNGKSFAGVWIKYIFREENIFRKENISEMKMLYHIFCKTRQIIFKSVIRDGYYIYPPHLNETFGIEPNTADELLYKIICK